MDRRYSPETIIRFLSKVALFSRCPKEELLKLALATEQRSYSAGEDILRPGVGNGRLGFVLSGRAALTLRDAVRGVDEQVETLRPGELFGEVGLFSSTSNPLYTVAKKDTRVVFLDRKHLVPLFRRDPELALLICHAMASRLVHVCMLGTRTTHSPLGAPQPDATPPTQVDPRPAAPAPADGNTIRWVDLGAYTISEELLDMVPAKLIHQHRLMPLELRDQTLTVGMVNPRSAVAIKDLRRVLHSVDPQVVAVSADEFNRTLLRLKIDASAGSKQNVASNAAQLTYAATQEKGSDKGKLIIGDEVIALFDRILAEAVDRNASDIHIEPDATGVRVRFRISGSLAERDEFLAPSYAAPLVGRIKVLSELDITEHRLPQDGRISAKIGRRELNLRVSTMAAARGEKVVIRLVDPADVMRPLHRIFVDPSVNRTVQTRLNDPYGAVVVAGPTGSGKSSTLYSMLNQRHAVRPDNNIVTVEDPVEFLMPKVTQVAVVDRVGLGFATILRGLMRQDPDVIMIGELRDRETASIMVEAALTGHLVLTSTHGNDAISVIQRLLHFGLDPVVLSQGLSMVVVQRLANRLCPSCVKDAAVAPALVDNLVARGVISPGVDVKLPRPVGCDSCNNTGYLGRVAVQEVLDFDDQLKALVARGAGPDELLTAAKKRKRLTTFAQASAYLMARRVLSPSDALLIVSD